MIGMHEIILKGGVCEQCGRSLVKGEKGLFVSQEDSMALLCPICAGVIDDFVSMILEHLGRITKRCWKYKEQEE